VNGPLVDAASVPDWLRRLVEGTSDLGAAAFTLLRPSRTLRPSPRMRTRAASVLILFGEGGRGPDVLLLRRADTLGSHAGQVAFPGGGAEDHDESVVATALREAEEETGVDPAGVRPLAVLPELLVPVSGFAVTPVLAHWERPSEVHAVDPAETAAVARVSVADLVDPVNRFSVRRSGTNWTGPAFAVDGLFIWGFTAGLLSALLTVAGWEREWDSADVRDLAGWEKR
jgi:8-oxo-dGTP pyrophosphatase MutT (NUDIX family)